LTFTVSELETSQGLPLKTDLLLSMKLAQGDLLESNFVKFEETIRELKSVGVKLEKTDIVCHLFVIA